MLIHAKITRAFQTHFIWLNSDQVHVIRDEDGLAVDYRIEGDFPKYGNNDDAVDSLAVDVVNRFMNKFRQHELVEHPDPFYLLSSPNICAYQ